LPGVLRTGNEALLAVVVAPVAVVAAIPVALFHAPTATFVDVVMSDPVGAAIRGAIPVATNPVVAGAIVAPVSVDPHVAVAGHRGTHLNTDGRRRSADVDMDLAESRCSEHCRRKREKCST
jgi:hypothetical protein